MSAVISTKVTTAHDWTDRQVEVQSSTDLKASEVAKYILIGIGAVFAAVILSPVALALAPYGFYKLHASHKKSAEAIEGMAVKRQRAVQEAVANVALPTRKTSDPLHKQVQKIQAMVAEVVKPGHTHAHMQAVREEIDKALSLPSYQSSKGDEANPEIAFLHQAVCALTVKSEGMNEMEAHGARLMEGQEREDGIKGLANALDSVVAKGSVFNKDSKIALLFWSIFHPQKAFTAFIGNQSGIGKYYNSYAHGNANIYLGYYQVNGKKVHFYQGPGPTGDRLFGAFLQHLENHGATHQQLSLEQPGQAGEAERRLLQLDMKEAHPDTLSLLAMPLDGPAWKGTGPFSGEMDSSNYFDTLKDFVMTDDAHRTMQRDRTEDNGFYFPKEAISDKELDDAFTFATTRFTEFEDNSSHFKDMDGKRENKARLLAFDTLVSVQAMFNYAKGSKGEMSYSQACKQDIDRGVIVNVLTRVYIDGMNGVTIDEAYINQLVGMVDIRPEMVEGRIILMDRFEPLSDMLHIIAADPDHFFGKMKAFFGDDVNSSFVPAKA